MINDLSSEDKQITEIKKGLSDGQTFYSATRTIQSEWPKMATKKAGQGKGKPAIEVSKACANQEEFNAFMADNKAQSELLDEV